MNIVLTKVLGHIKFRVPVPDLGLAIIALNPSLVMVCYNKTHSSVFAQIHLYTKLIAKHFDVTAPLSIIICHLMDLLRITERMTRVLPTSAISTISTTQRTFNLKCSVIKICTSCFFQLARL